jgi:hypothetical protein
MYCTEQRYWQPSWREPTSKEDKGVKVTQPIVSDQEVIALLDGHVQELE